MNGFLKLNRTPELASLIKNHPKAYILLTIISIRADRADSMCMLGDYKNYGLTKQEYRTAKIVLEANGYAAFQKTNKGTIAKLLGSEIFDINPDGYPENSQKCNTQNNTQNSKIQHTKPKNSTLKTTLKEQQLTLCIPDSCSDEKMECNTQNNTQNQKVQHSKSKSVTLKITPIKNNKEKYKEENKENNILSKFEIAEQVETIYQAYPAKCPTRGSTNGKSLRDKEKIKQIIKTYGFDEALAVVVDYVDECKKHNVYMKNFKTFLNNFPEPIKTQNNTSNKQYEQLSEQKQQNLQSTANNALQSRLRALQ